MHQFETIRKFKFNSTVVMTIPLLIVAVFCVDAIHAFARVNSLADSGSIIKAMTASSTTVLQESGNRDGLDRTLRSHYIQLNDQNRLTGTISAIEKETGATIPVGSLTVKLIQRSQPVSVTTTDSTGRFTTDVVSPGSYTLCITGSEGFLAYGVQVIDSDLAPGEAVPIPDVIPELNMDETEVGEDIGSQLQKNQTGDRLNSLVTHQLSVQEVSAQEVLASEDGDVEITAAVIPPTHKVLEEIMAGVPGDTGFGMSGDAGTKINVEESVVAGGFQIRLQEDGKLVGRIAPLTSQDEQPIRLREMNVYLLKDDEIINQVIADEDGNFTFSDVDPDVYGFAAAGRDGFAALSFQAIENLEDDQQSLNQGDGVFQNASARLAQAEASDELQVAICPPEDIPFLRSEVESLNREPVNEEVGEDFAEEFPTSSESMLAGDFGYPGGFGPGGGTLGGGSAGGPSLSGLGPLIEAGIAAWVISELFDDSNNTVRNPPSVSPF